VISNSNTDIKHCVTSPLFTFNSKIQCSLHELTTHVRRQCICKQDGDEIIFTATCKTICRDLR